MSTTGVGLLSAAKKGGFFSTVVGTVNEIEATNASTRRAHRKDADVKTRDTIDGELKWIGEYKNRDIRCYKLSKGSQIAVEGQELKLFQRTPYERGFTEYVYEGSIKLHKALPPPDPANPNSDASTNNMDPRCGMREGKGILWYPNGSMFEGSWKDDQRHGHGFLSTDPDGRGYKYTGEWLYDVPDGKGFESGASGVTYDGTFVGNLPCGKGVLLFNSKVSDYRYEGEFSNGLRHGKGVIFYDNGDVFEGTWDQGRRHGRGVTTTMEFGSEVQLESEWDQDKLVKPPQRVLSMFTTKKKKPHLQFSKNGHVAAADLRTWKVKDDVQELTLEHFMRIKLGFEGLDVYGTGSLATAALEVIWPEEGAARLKKLDQDGNGSVELNEIFMNWYPCVPNHNVLRFMAQDINPRDLLKIRGILNGVVSTKADDPNAGYLTMCGVDPNFADESDPPLSLEVLRAKGYLIGGERFSIANYNAARQLHDPPHFPEILEIWYPNIPPLILNRYEMTAIDNNELVLIIQDFYRLSEGLFQIDLAKFVKAQDEFQGRIKEQYEAHQAEVKRKAEEANRLLAAANAAANLRRNHPGGPKPSDPKSVVAPPQPAVPPSSSSQDGDQQQGEEPAGGAKKPQDLDNEVMRSMEEGFFKGFPIWRVGNMIRLSVQLLKDIRSFYDPLPPYKNEEDRSDDYCISLPNLLRYCFPNVPCKRMKEYLGSRKKGFVSGATSAEANSNCFCVICTVQ